MSKGLIFSNLYPYSAFLRWSSHHGNQVQPGAALSNHAGVLRHVRVSAVLPPNRRLHLPRYGRPSASLCDGPHRCLPTHQVAKPMQKNNFFSFNKIIILSFWDRFFDINFDEFFFCSWLDQNQFQKILRKINSYKKKLRKNFGFFFLESSETYFVWSSREQNRS